MNGEPDGSQITGVRMDHDGDNINCFASEKIRRKRVLFTLALILMSITNNWILIWLAIFSPYLVWLEISEKTQLLQFLYLKKRNYRSEVGI